jgi:hypothetical protein
MPVLYANNAVSALSASITNVATSFSVTAGHGARFPVIAGGDYFYATLMDSAGNLEVVKVTARATDTFTVQRAQEGTTARAYAANDIVELRITKAMLDDFKTDTRTGYLPLTGGTVTGVTTFSNASDTQIILNGGGTSWAGISWTDVSGTDYTWFNGSTSTFAIGGGGSTVSGKKLHVHGGMTIGSGYAATANPTNGLNVEGAIQQAGNQVLHAGNYNSYAPTLTGTGASGSWGISVTGNAATATNVAYSGLTGTVPTWNQNTTGNADTASNASLLNSISAVNLYNNMGDSHSTRTSFDATTPSYGFGYRFVQGSSNGPATGGSQYYSWYIGLGSDYPATGAGSYGAMFAVDRNSTTPYLSVRYNEGNGFTAWQKIRAGYADTAATATNVAYSGLTGTVPTWNQNTTGNAATATNISNTGTVTLATATESNAITITAPSYTTGTPVKLLNFEWYGNTFSLGNIRSGATPSDGFGVYYTASGGSLTEIARFGTGGTFNTIGAITQNGSQVLTAGNYNSYAPTLTGTGASGSWGISITGNAATATNVAYSGLTGTVPTWNQSTTGSSNAVSNTGFGNGNFTWYQTPDAFAGNSGWASYLISNHGDGNTYYSQTLIMPFWGAPQYSRKQGNSTVVGPYTFLTTENYTSYSPSLTGGGASGSWGINVTGTSGSISGFNNPTTAPTANTIAYRDAAGDIAAREIVLSSGLSGVTPTVLVSMYPTTNQMVRTTPAAVAAAIQSAASGSWGISITGNAATATNLSTNRTNWSTNGTLTAVVGQLAWKNYGNDHTIFDASNGTAPDGSAVSNTNATTAWSGSYPTLMGWNGAGTYGVRVDSARVADSASQLGGINSNRAMLKRRGRIHSSDSTSLNSSISAPEMGFTYGGSGEPTGPYIAFGGLSGDIDYSCQLVGAYSGGGNDFKIRTRNDDTVAWNSWRTILTDGNYNSYSPTLTGGSASGTWGISVTGNAATATNVAYSGLTGTVPTWNQNTTGTAAISTAATVTTSATASAFKVPFANTTASTTGNYGLLQDSEATFTYNPSTNTLTVGTVSGALSGNATTATTANALNTGNNYQVNSIGVGAAASGTAGRINGTTGVFTPNTTGVSTGLTVVNGDLTAYRSGGTTGVVYLSSSGSHYLYWDGTNYNLNSGNLVCTGNVTAYSDERLKKDWAPVAANFVSRLATVKSGTYTRTDNGERQAGSSAQDWQKLLPEVVTAGADDKETLSLAYGNAALVSAVELAKEVVELRAKLVRLEAIVAKLIED